MKDRQLRRRIYEIIEKSDNSNNASKAFNYFIVILVCLNIAAVITASFSNLPPPFLKGLEWFEYFSVAVFTAEYALRILTAPHKYPDSKHPYLKYVFSFMAIIDLLAILPFYLPFFINVDARFLRILRLFRLLRILKLNRYNNALELIGRVLKNEKEKLLMTSFILLILLLFASSTMYFIEGGAQPDKFPNILSTLWWAIETLTTIGYGDVHPTTSLGKILSGIIAILGIGLIALPSGIISSGLIQLSGKRKKNATVCPHCGRKIEPDTYGSTD